MKKAFVFISALCAAAVLFGCSNSAETEMSGVVDAPEDISTLDEAKVAKNPNIRVESDNVNGMCYAISLESFSTDYNEMLKEAGSLDMLNADGWKALGSVREDANGVEYQNYYYDADDFNLTASVETESGYIINIGLGTTMSSFVDIEDGAGGKSNSDEILMKSAVMAAAAGGLGIEKVDTLQDIFYTTTLENVGELWYEGNVYALSMNEDKNNSERSTMLFRAFPVSDEVKENWEVQEYEAYVAENTVGTSAS